MEAQEKLKIARVKLLLKAPFFGYLVTNLQDVIDDQRTRTASTDGHRVYWNTEFLARLDAQDVTFVLAHEALHNALGHLSRRSARSPYLWNVATDMVVNDSLKEAGFATKLNGLYGAQNGSAENVFDAIEKLSRETGATFGQSWDDHSAWEISESESRELSEYWRQALSQATTFGKTPKDLELEVEQLLYPKRDWRAYLADALRFPVDYKMVPPDRRFSQILLPTLDGDRRRVVVAIDSSGSITPEKLTEFVSELRSILSAGASDGTVIVCDAKIQSEHALNEFEVSSIKKIKGGGGTDFRPVFTKLAEDSLMGATPDALIYLTDLVGSFPIEAPMYRVLWAVRPEDARQKPPFGELVVLE
jgi:predicted metal-dependent peptidase